MNEVTYDVGFTEARNRVTTIFRYFMAIPLMIVAGVIMIGAYFVTAIQWWVILFTGKRNRGMAEFTINALGSYARAMSYSLLMFDEYPKFGFDPSGVPMVYSLQYEEKANRLTNALRIFWAIPAMLLMLVIMIGAEVLTVVQWFTIVFTGKAKQSHFDFVKRALHFALKVNSYLFLTTDAYPKFV